MNCEQITELMPDYMVGVLATDQMKIVEEHLHGCTACAGEVTLWKKMSLLPVEKPTEESRQRFDAMLHAYPSSLAAEHTGIAPATGSAQVKREFDWSAAMRWLRSPVGALAWSMALLVFGVLVGTAIGTKIGDGNAAREREIADMHAELTNTRQMVALSMLQEQSASDRLQGVNYTNREDHLDPQVFAALMHTLRYDNSVDVRLAALDALSRHAGQPAVRKSVGDSLQTQQSPMVQVALIDLLSEWRDPEAAQRLRNFQQTPNLNPTVRQRAQWAVSKLQ